MTSSARGFRLSPSQGKSVLKSFSMRNQVVRLHKVTGIAEFYISTCMFGTKEGKTE